MILFHRVYLLSYLKENSLLEELLISRNKKFWEWCYNIQGVKLEILTEIAERFIKI